MNITLMPTLRTLLLLATVLLISARPASTEETFPLSWSTVEGWRGETIPFPLDFAPSLPYSGVEELRFSPGFFNPAAPDYFTYAFAWLVDETTPINGTRLETDLQAYFSGLMEAVGRDQGRAERPLPEETKVKVHQDDVEVEVFFGTIETWDAFTNGQKLHLDFQASAVSSLFLTENHLELWYFEVSPRLGAPPIRAQLEKLRSGLKASPPNIDNTAP